MPPATTQALIILALAVLPGALYVWAFEREAGAYGVTVADRVLRLLAVSAAIQVVFAPLAYAVWRLAFQGHNFKSGQFALVWAGTLVLLGIPYVLGSVVGAVYAARANPTRRARLRQWLHLTPDRESRLIAVTGGARYAPTAWDAFFSGSPGAVVRVRTKTSGIVHGIYGKDSYAGGFPHSRDLLLEDTWAVDSAGKPRSLRGVSLLLPPEEIVAVEIRTRSAVKDGGP